LKANLDGLESDWESPGLGSSEIEFIDLPKLGCRFDFIKNNQFHSTSPVQRMRKEPGKISFITKHSTYILTGDL
jgi:hypothetical protein